MAAGSDTAALVVALSAQLTKFEKDMKDAVKVADTNVSQIESRFAKMNTTISNELSGFVGSYAAQAGAVGRVLQSIGPLGLTIAAGIGAASLAMSFLIDKTEQYAAKQKELKETSEITGLSLNQLKAVGEIGKRVGVDSEQSIAIIVRLGTALEELKTKGTGPLFDSLLKLGGGWLRQVAGAKDLAEAIDILSQAFDSAATAGQKLQLASAIGGRRQAGPTARLFGGIGEAGGLDATVKNLQATGQAIDEIANKKIVELQRQLEETRRRTDNIWGRAFGPEVLTFLNNTASLWERIARGAEKAMEAKRKYDASTGGQDTFLSSLFKQQVPLNAPVTPVERGGDLPAAIDKNTEALRRHQEQVASDLQAMQKWIGILGDAVTLQEQHTQKLLAIENATINEGLAVDKATRARKAADDQLTIGTTAIRERLGVATELQIAESRNVQTTAEAQKAGLSEAETLKALAKSALDAEKAFEAMTVSASRLPGITRYAFDSSFIKQFDQTMVTMASNFENALGSIANGTTTLKDAFHNLANSIIADLVRMTIRLSVTGPLLRSLGLAFGTPTGGTGLAGNTTDAGWFAPLSSGSFIPQRQGGGPVSARSPYIVGEHGPELFVPKTAGNIVPSNVQHAAGGGAGYKVTVNNYASGQVETTQERRQQGAGMEELVIGIVQRTIARGDADASQRARFGLRPNKVR